MMHPGLIIAASVVVAASIAIYENEQVRQWLDIHRRRIAIALYSLGDGINPSESDLRSPEQQAEMAELNRQRRHDIVRQNREDLIRKAREEGTAVDLDELTALGVLEREAEEEAEQAQQALQIQKSHQRSGSNTSFDDFVGNDGKLKRDLADQKIMDDDSTATTTAVPSVSDSGLRQRGAAGARGFALGSALSNPFGDEMEIHEDEQIIAPSADEFPLATTVADTHIIRSVSPRPEEEAPVPDSFYASAIREVPIWQVDSTPISAQREYKTEDELNAEIEEAIRRSLDDKHQQLVDISSPAYTTTETMQPSSKSSTPHSLSDSLFGPPSPRSGFASAVQARSVMPEMSTSSAIPTMIPQASPFGSFYSATGDTQAIDVTLNDGERTPSGAMTPTDDGFSTISSVAGDREPEMVRLADIQSEADTNDSFSVVGASTPGSWSEVDSDSETEAGNGQSHIIRR
jgi:hypothetical protein